MTDTITTTPVREQDPTELNTPWTLHFGRDRTEDYGIICDADGEELVASHLPGTNLGERTFETGTFWLPEKNDPTPQRFRQMQVMTAAPKLLDALESMVRWAERHGVTTAELISGGRAEVPVIGIARAAIAEATDNLIGRAA